MNRLNILNSQVKSQSTAVTPTHYIDPMPFPKTRHESFPQHAESCKWDTKKHLQFEHPTHVATLDENITLRERPVSKEHMEPGVAYSKPFRVVSKEGEKELYKVIQDHKDYIKKNERQKGGIMRGIGYMSKFVEEFIYDKEFLKNISEVAGEPLAPATFGSHIVQVNFGPPGIGADVDKWHFDSVDYVLVIILSDITDMKGGEL